MSINSSNRLWWMHSTGITIINKCNSKLHERNITTIKYFPLLTNFWTELDWTTKWHVVWLSNTGTFRALHVVLQLVTTSLDKCLIHISNSPIKAHLPNTLANCSILALSPLKRSSMNLLMASTSTLPFLICREESITKYNTLLL